MHEYRRYSGAYRKSLATDVHEGRLQAGEMFPSERDLCARFGVGRTLVRSNP